MTRLKQKLKEIETEQESENKNEESARSRKRDKFSLFVDVRCFEANYEIILIRKRYIICIYHTRIQCIYLHNSQKKLFIYCCTLFVPFCMTGTIGSDVS